jgi:hypothetical protein
VAKAVAASDVIAATLFPCFETLVTNGDVDTVRVKAVKACGPLITNMDARACEATILPLFETLVGDRSWTIRHAAVTHFAALAGVVGADTTRSVLAGVISSMLEDPEGEVRKACINQMTAVLNVMGASAAKSKEGLALLDGLAQLAEDEYAAVRMAVMECAMSLLRAGNEAVHDLVMTFAESEEDETKLPVLADLTEIARNLPKGEVGDKLMPIIESILVGWKAGGREPMSQTIGGSDSGGFNSCVVIYPQDAGSSWRQRQKVIANLTGIGRHIGEGEYTASLLPLLLATLTDPINAVRCSAACAPFLPPFHRTWRSVGTRNSKGGTADSLRRNCATHALALTRSRSRTRPLPSLPCARAPRLDRSASRSFSLSPLPRRSSACAGRSRISPRP